MAAGRIVLPPYFPARDRNARLVPGALLAVYDDNTTTKAPIYSDQALTTPLTNPVAANSSGQFPAIWCEAGTTEAPVLYSLAISDAAGQSIGNPAYFTGWQPSVDAGTAQVALAEAAAEEAGIARDETEAFLAEALAIQASGDDAAAIAARVRIADLAAAIGAALVGFKQNDPDALTRTLLDKLRDIVHATDFAVGGGIGTSDDTAGLVAALVHCELTGRDLYIPAISGGFNITDELFVPANVRVLGPGSIEMHTANRTVLTMASNTQLEGVTIRGTGLSNNTLFSYGGRPTNIGVFVPAGATNVRIHGCDISGCEGSGIYDAGAVNVWYKDNFLHDNTWGHGGAHSTAYATASDILFYSATATSGIVEVTGNRCVSNNSQAIAFSMLGVGRDCLISHNYMDVWDAAGARITYASGNLKRRHGVITNYLSQATGIRVWVHHNIIRNMLWSGVYGQASTNDTAPLEAESNLIIEVGWDTTSALSGGVFLMAKGKQPVIARGNIIVDFKNNSGGTGAITLNSTSDASNHIQCEDNHIMGSLGRGYSINNYADHVVIKGGSIRGCTEEDIGISLATGTTGTAGIVVSGVDIERSIGTKPMIRFDPSNGTNRLTVSRCSLKGVGKATVSDDNAAIATLRPLQTVVVDNDIRDVYRGINSLAYLPAATRMFSETNWDGNRFRDVGIAFGLGSTANTSVFPVCDNTLNNVTTVSDGSSLSGFTTVHRARRAGLALEVYGLPAAPTTGTWATGDEAVLASAAAGGVPRTRCTTGGNPGTWKSYAALAA